MDFLTRLFDTQDFPARWTCGRWSESHGYLHIFSDLGIWSAYLTIPIILWYFARNKTGLPFRRLFILFGAFILLCGTTHLMEAIIFWWPAYRLAGVIKAMTAVVSWATVLSLVPVVPKALAMRVPEDLEREIAARHEAEKALRIANLELEKRVQERTAELEAAILAMGRERELLRTTISSVGDGLIVTDLDNRITMINGVAERLTGWTQTESIGQPIERVFQIVDETTRETVENPAARVLTEGTIVGLPEPATLINKHGVEYLVSDSAAPIRDASGTIRGAVLVFRDVTDARIQQKELERREQDFRTLADSMPQLCWMAQPDGYIFWYNRRWYEYTGTTFEDMQGWGWQSVHDPKVLPDVIRNWKQAINLGKPLEMTFPIRGQDGTFRHFLTRVVPLTDDTGHIVRWFGTNTDISEKEWIEAELRERQQFVQRVLDASPGIVYIYDLERRETVFINQRVQVALGLSAEEVERSGLTFLQDYVHPDDLPLLQEHFARVAADATDDVQLSAEYRIRHANGNWLWFVSRDVIFNYNEDGDVSQVLGVVVDITERKLAEEAFHYQQGLTQLITENATTAIFMTDENRVCTFMNPAAEQITGFTAREMIGQNLHERLHHHYPDGRPYPIEECPLAMGLRVYREFRNHEDLFFRKNGEPFRVAYNARVIQKNGRPAGTVIEIRDITAEKQAAELDHFLAAASDMLASLQDFRSTLDQIAQYSVKFLCDWCVIDLLDENRQIHRVASAHIDPKQTPVLDELREKYSPVWDSNSVIAQVLTSGESRLEVNVTQELLLSVAQDTEHLRILEELKPRSLVVVPLKVRGHSLGTITYVRCDSRRRYSPADLEAAQELARRAATAIDNARLYENLQDSDRRKDEFLATLAHELRNPLAPLNNGLQVLKLDGQNKESLELVRNMMERQLTQMVRLVDDLLDVSRITRNKLELRKDLVRLSSVIQSAVETSQPLIELSGHQLHLQIPDDPIYLDADATRLAQIFSNLLNNAAKYTPRGGKITLAVQRNSDCVVVSVRDTGVGISAEMLPRVFEMFTQDETTRQQSLGGLGIGLTLVRRLTEMHGGTVDVQSAGLGQGSEFVVRLPVRTDLDLPEQTTEPPATVPAATVHRILIADDNEDSAESLRLLLELLGHTVQVVHDGQAAVDTVSHFHPSIVLLDIGMPKLNGYEACKQIRQLPGGEELLIVAQTGWGQREDHDRSRGAGFDLHLVKPIDMNQLEHLLKQERSLLSQ